MKIIGMLGGMSWESTQSYYRAVNEGVREALGGLHSAKVILYSVDFAEIEEMQHKGDWDKTAAMLTDAACSVERAGADFLIICTNTMHIAAPKFEEALSIPLLHIADATADALKNDGINRVGLLGTRFTMEQPFYRSRLEEKFKIEVVVPNQEERRIVHDIIYRELCLGKIREESKDSFRKIITALEKQGAEAVILGCTEIALLIKQEDTGVPLYDTTAIHAKKAVEMALK